MLRRFSFRNEAKSGSIFAEASSASTKERDDTLNLAFHYIDVIATNQISKKIDVKSVKTLDLSHNNFEYPFH